MRCDKCKHWEPEDEQFYHPFGFGLCKATPFQETIGAWKWNDDFTDATWAVSPEHVGTTATVVDASAYHAELWTAPGHFCAMFEMEATDGTD